MKASILVKVFLILPLILFGDYLLMTVIGCASCLFGFGEDYYCSGFCLAGKIILGLSLGFFGFLVYPDIKSIRKRKTDGTSE